MPLENNKLNNSDRNDLRVPQPASNVIVLINVQSGDLIRD